MASRAVVPHDNTVNFTTKALRATGRWTRGPDMGPEASRGLRRDTDFMAGKTAVFRGEKQKVSLIARIR